ncbi:uncharacterized protein LOC118347684 [Juglans regia]|uniref:Uncharacterized protein LOC118347684 n=1 Tax=Juglans regia TaxID=51240 RepID=A0A6P9E662_JUGRE|nr:uncharacterized protein LOC118347684 [Juglans regia]
MEVPGGYKHFVWNALNNVLPTKNNLLKRKVTEDSLCPVCKREEKDVKHALWCCLAVADVWAEAESPVRKWRNQVQDFTSLWMELIKRLSKGCLERIVAIMRGIWGRRNAFVFENEFGCPSKMVRSALVFLEEYKEATLRMEGRHTRSEVSREDKRWKRPVPNKYKLNFDAAIDLTNRMIGIGIVVRDCNGEVMVVICTRKDHVFSPFIVECLALKRFIKLCKELGFWSVMMKGNAKGVIEAVLAEEKHESKNGQLIEDTKRLFAQGLHWTLGFIHRE